MTKATWYASNGSGGQGLIIDESTGRTVAVAYDDGDAPLLSAAPDMLAALEPMRDLPCGPPMRTGPLAGTVPVYLTQAQIDAMCAALAKARGSA